VLDVAPFMVGARTLVPLRFVAQALGATVDYNNGTNTVTIASTGGRVPPGGPGGPGIPGRPGMPPGFAMVNPFPTGSVGIYNATFGADFNAPLAQQSVVVMLDGRNVTQFMTWRSTRGIQVALPYPLNPGQHNVVVRGQTFDGRQFQTGWQFVADPRLR
jgi:hypothetical protein